ncbi:ciliated left-right organizer metallopeptidase isoform X3 [Lutra lutra]|uniref:ciliated left-right organizer metallopeptidase isoform X3 n=1 Tax=Lutra lutra TaxID=9657 RepID=UPI001FD5B172|nr:ciliated left-right organizer metallopeptidase isoform X3 [Lutra lutra]
MFLLLLLVGTAVSRCLHDETQKSVTLLRPHLSQPAPSFRFSALALPGSHEPQPLRIRTYSIRDPVSDGAWEPEGAGMRGGPRALALAAARQAAQQLQGMLTVPPVQGPLLLSRDPAQYCHAVWGDPDAPNYHRCSLLNPGYKGESCLGAKIPDAHLRGYALWPEHGPPQLVQPDGPGVQDTDFLLYVWVAHTSKCRGEPSVIAYAACCQLDSEDRPLAGTIIYCAQHLSSPSLSHSDIVMVTLHELLHALGFSGQLFKKWRDCPSGPSVRENCSTRQQVTRRDEWGQLLLTTPAVSHSLARHLGVPGASPGVPLEEEGPLSSHWEARLLQGSIMTATFDGARRTRLDPITLAAFEDSGWYRVNHSAAEELPWGQAGSGLEFGLVTTCGAGSSDFFCTGSELGCHYLHLDKGSCSSDPMLEGCRMYKPLANGSECWKKENGFPPGAENPHGEIYHSQSRCFLANLTSHLLREDETRHPSEIPHPVEAELTGRCYLHQCTERGAYEVRAEGTAWVPCLPGKAIQIPGYSGLLFCPRGRLCQTFIGTSAVTSPPVSLPPQDLLFQLSLQLAGPPGPSVGKEELDGLTEAVLQALVSRGGTGRLLVILDHKPSVTHLALSTGLCLTLLILVGALGTVAYQKRATLLVAPSGPHRSPELQDTRGPVTGMREV